MAFYHSFLLGKHDPSDAIWELQLIVSVHLKGVCILFVDNNICHTFKNKQRALLLFVKKDFVRQCGDSM